MSIRPIDPQFPGNPDSAYTGNLVYQLKRILSVLTNRVNGLSEGRISSIDNAATAAPTTGTWAQGDFIRNSAPAEAGVVTTKYVVFGWVCSVSGTPGTWLQCRFLTGN
jgi:hypothetical protein